MDLTDLRRDFGKFGLDAEKMPEHPVDLLEEWLQAAKDEGISEFNAMVLSTVSLDSKPSSRIVLLKEVSDDKSLVFFTNYHSRKGKEIMGNPNVCVNFFWRELERQVRVEGTIRKTTVEVSKSYFKSRPLESQLSVIVSPQSQTIKKLSTLKEKADQLFLSGEPITLPENWGGYRLNPNAVEFWQGGKNRLHDRIRYTQQGHFWFKDRLAP